MKSKNNALELLCKFLDGDLSPEQEKRALYIIAENKELRENLRFDKYLKKSLIEEHELESFSVPDNFSDDVMNRIEQMEEESSPALSWTDILANTIRGWLAPRQYTFRPALVYVVPAVILIIYTSFFQGGIQPPGMDLNPVGMSSENEPSTQVQYISEDSAAEQVWIRFVYIDEEAGEVAVAGNFSDWNPVEMTRQEMNGKNVWTGLVSVERGEHHYMFIKDGEEWISDPLAEVHRDDGFGNKNAVIYL